MTQKISRVLIANRGEIAVRIMRTLREQSIESVAIYSDADAKSLHRSFADFAVRLPGNTSAETYLDIPRLKSAIESSGADAVHPGYGFLSESEEFARAVKETGATFIGPSPESMALLGDKIAAKKLMRKENVPVVPGSIEALSSAQDCIKLANEIGYPLILKAASGGGGRGMRVVYQDSEVAEAFAACTREAQSYFANPAVFCERYIANPRHIEVQVLCDNHGNGIHLYERDCSVQRRHQKLVEEAPSSFLAKHQDIREKLGGIAVKAALAANYSGAGTVEFICESPEQIYFMEMNTRIQVEHPVTEMITGVDLIAEQVEVAKNKPLRYQQKDIQIQGHSIEIRVNAENPFAGFAPSPGVIKKLSFPAGPGTRIDSHAYPGYEIPPYYDSLIAKVISWAPDRQTAITRTIRLLAEMVIDGPATTNQLAQAILSNEKFCSGEFDTGFLEAEWESLLSTHTQSEDLGSTAALAAMLGPSQQVAPVSNSTRDAWQRRAANELTRGGLQ